MEQAKHAVAEVKRLESDRSVILDRLNSRLGSKEEYDLLRASDSENWKALKQARQNLCDAVMDIFGENMFDLKKLCGY